jgi:hypothetical protein
MQLSCLNVLRKSLGKLSVTVRLQEHDQAFTNLHLWKRKGQKPTKKYQ